MLEFKKEQIWFAFFSGGPPSKPKYKHKTDSEQVPWGKGEKNPKTGSEIEILKFDTNNQSKPIEIIGNGVPFV